MKILIILFLFFNLQFIFAETRDSGDPFFIGDPMSFYKPTEQLVKFRFPDSKLLFISTFGSGSPDPRCSKIGWQFIYEDSNSSVGIRRSFRHISQLDGSCAYVPDEPLRVSKEDFPILGYSPVQNRINLVRVKLQEAMASAIEVAGNGFSPRWVKLVTPVHPRAAGRIFWNFRGPVFCNKATEITIDASTGLFEPYFSTVSECE